jgi:hypothetical protein
MVLAIASPAVGDDATVLGLRPKGRSGRHQDTDGNGKDDRSFHCSNLPITSNGSQHSGLLAYG